MSPLREWLTRLAGLLRRGSRDLDDELAFHRQMLEDRLRAEGRTDVESRRLAAVQLGGRAQIAEAYRDQQSIPWIESLLQDLRYGARVLRRAPGFTTAAVLTLALGIGATTAIFTAVNAVLLRPLPYPSPGELVVFGDSGGSDAYGNLGYPTFTDFRDRTQTLQQIAAVRSWQVTLMTTEAERLPAMRVSWNYFSLLGIEPAIGRTFRAEDDHPDRYRVLVLSDGLWRRRFSADPNVVGRTIRMNDETFEIIGVMPRDFEDVLSAQAYKPAELWGALGYAPSLSYGCRGCRHLKAIGRLRPDATVQQAADDLSSIRADLARQFPTEYDADRVAVTRLTDAVSGPVREPLYVLLAAVGFVLLIACANVANLLLARAMNRTREMLVRAALGAGRARLIRQLVTESLLLWTIGGVAGVGIGAVLVGALAGIAPGELPRAGGLAIDGRVLLFALSLSLVTGLLFGLLPALSATSLRASGGFTLASRGTVGASSRRTRQVLLMVDLAVALVLLVGAGLMLMSVSKLLRVDPGFEAERVLTAQFSLVGQAYREDAAVHEFIKRLVDRVGAMPGVEAAAAAGQVPMGGNGDRFGIHIQGLEPANPADAPSPERYSVTPDYFRAMRIPLLRGRLIQPEDTPTSTPVMLVSETAARTLFQGRDPIGQRVRVGGLPQAPWRTIVGVVGDVRHAELTETAWPQMYLPQSQFTDSFLVLVVKGSNDNVTALVPSIRAALRQQDPTVPLYDVAPLPELLARSTAQRRFVMWLLSGFAGVALLLAAIGLYGVVSYTVAQRTREVGLRVALGAGRGDILRLVLGSGAATVAAGIAIGVVAAAVLTRFIQGQLFDVEPLDPLALISAVVVLTAVVGAAHLMPIRRAFAVDPTVALRDE